MKVNFWQGLGIALIVVGVIFYARSQFGDDTVPATNPSAVTQPAAAGDALRQDAGASDAVTPDADASDVVTPDAPADAEPATRPGS